MVSDGRKKRHNQTALVPSVNGVAADDGFFTTASHSISGIHCRMERGHKMKLAFALTFSHMAPGYLPISQSISFPFPLLFLLLFFCVVHLFKLSSSFLYVMARRRHRCRCLQRPPVTSANGGTLYSDYDLYYNRPKFWCGLSNIAGTSFSVQFSCFKTLWASS
jgi:hypothetical protein